MTAYSRCMPNTGLRSTFKKTFALSGLLAALFAAPAFADEAAEVTKLVRAGQHAQALTRADAFLGKNPRDAQMRFLKGVILTEQNKAAEAIVIFTKLTEDFPSLPEPYNNLAVLYAANGQYDKARAALDAAIRTNPAYATAYENLGDVHAKLASQAYDKALQLDSGNSAAKSKLTLVRSFVSNMDSNSNTKMAAVQPAPKAITPAPAPAPAAVAPSQNNQIAAAPSVPAAKPAPAPANQVAATPAAPAVKPAPAPNSQVAVAPPSTPVAKPAVPESTKQEAKPAANDNAEREQVLTAVTGWARAWSSQDVKSYLGFYGSDFDTPNGQSRKGWEDERRSRIVGKGRINVRVEAPQVAVKGNTATVKFRQVYVSDRLTANTRKTLVLTKHAGKWQIKQEQTGS